jgi:hypothetical protein
MDVYHALAVERVAAGDAWNDLNYEMYAAELSSPYRERRFAASGRLSRTGTVEDILSPPDGLMLFCGMSIGFEDAAVPFTGSGRAPLHETVAFVD